MELSRGFVERLSEIFFNEEMNGEPLENKFSEIFLNEDMSNNIIKDEDLTKNGS